MRLAVLAVGLIRGTHEAPLYENYARRIAQSGRQIGFDGLHLTEIKEHATASAKLLAALESHNGLIVLLDESGESWSSRQFADKLAAWRDDGRGGGKFAALSSPRLGNAGGGTLTAGFLAAAAKR